MTAEPGAATRDVVRGLAEQRHRRAVHLVDGEVIRRALSGCSSAIEAATDLEREVVIAIADTDGFDRQTVARGLGISKSGVDRAIVRQRRAASAMTRDLMAAVMLRPAADLVSAVREHDPDAVASLLVGLDCQRLAALAVVLAGMVADPDLTAGVTTSEDT